MYFGNRKPSPPEIEVVHASNSSRTRNKQRHNTHHLQQKDVSMRSALPTISRRGYKMAGRSIEKEREREMERNVKVAT
jgi:hypothetical protein